MSRLTSLVAARILATYPPAWRDRYGAEMDTALHDLSAHGLPLRIGDLALGLLDAWAHPTLPEKGSTSMTEQIAVSAEHARRVVRPAAWSLLLFLFGGAGFAKLIEDPGLQRAADNHPLIRISIGVLIGAACAVAAVMLIATVVALLAFREDGANSLAVATRAGGVVAVAIIGEAAAILVASRIAGTGGAHSARNVVVFLILCAVTVVAGVGATVAALRLASQLPETLRVRAMRRTATVAVGALVGIGVAAVIAWAVGIAVTTSSRLSADGGLVATPTWLTLAGVVAAMAAAAVGFARAGRAALHD